MLEISELIWETCKTYLIQQGKFLAILWVFIAAIMVWYFSREMDSFKVGVIVVFSIVGILGSYSVAWFGIRMNTFANSRTAFAGLKGKPYPTLEIPSQGRDEHRDAPDRRRAGPHAHHPPLRPR